ncbi:MAG: hypothetical protein ACI9UV_000109 [Algoriphagus sp.]|jgi:hypothetical protein
MVCREACSEVRQTAVSVLTAFPAIREKGIIYRDYEPSIATLVLFDEILRILKYTRSPVSDPAIGIRIFILPRGLSIKKTSSGSF